MVFKQSVTNYVVNIILQTKMGFFGTEILGFCLTNLS